MKEINSIFIIRDNKAEETVLENKIKNLSGFEMLASELFGDGAIDEVKRFLPDLVLFALGSNNCSAIEKIQLIKRTSPRTKIVVKTKNLDDKCEIELLIAGADYCFVSTPSDRDLAELLHVILEEKPRFHRRIAGLIYERLSQVRDGSSKPVMNLSNQEKLILQRKAQGISNKKIAQELSVSEQVVNGHLVNILEKLHFIGRLEMLLAAHQESDSGNQVSVN
ncbi:MAG: response regulator transcription factor [Chloroflexota bacterium]|nr:MAG: response regulator transcription factor [Chloroflexota bacterium]